MMITEWLRINSNFCRRELVSKETVVLRRWGVETNVWFINRVGN